MEDASVLEVIGSKIDDVAGAIPPQARSFLGGEEWLGHPLHPLLTDLPIGFWTSAWVLDIIGGRRSRRIATTFVGLGVASAVPTIAAGIVEFAKLEDAGKRKTGVIHMLANGVATWFYVWSFFARLRGLRGRGIMVGMLGATAATVGGYLGGQLVFGQSDENPTEVDAAHGADRQIKLAV